jgi:small subunit ribosomal protein S15
MARTHARTKGKSGSTRPVTSDLSFVTMKAKDVEKLIIKMAKEDAISASKIGLILRDTHAIPSVKALCGKSVGQILSENDLLASVPEDLNALVAKVRGLKKHLSTNTRDTHNKRGLILIEAKIRRLSTYYKKKGSIPTNWVHK